MAKLTEIASYTISRLHKLDKRAWKDSSDIDAHLQETVEEIEKVQEEMVRQMGCN